MGIGKHIVFVQLYSGDPSGALQLGCTLTAAASFCICGEFGSSVCLVPLLNCRYIVTGLPLALVKPRSPGGE